MFKLSFFYTDGCISYILEGKGDFKLQKKEYSLQNSNFVIDSIRLVRRTSFYKCEPVSMKYGTDPDRRAWWVDRGCEGIFEIQECPSDGTEVVPGKIYEYLAVLLVFSISLMAYLSTS